MESGLIAVAQGAEWHNKQTFRRGKSHVIVIGGILAWLDR